MIYQDQTPQKIDIFEMLTWTNIYGTPRNNIMTTNLHYTYPGQDPTDGFAYHNIGNWDDVYRTFAIEWNPNEIIWYVDGVHYRTYSNHEIQDPIKILLTFAISLNPSEAPTVTQKDFLIDYRKAHLKRIFIIS